LLNHEDERKKIALAGHQRTLKFHTVENRCRIIIDILEEVLNHSPR
jgi:spore maturation protein CgeB